MKYLNKKALLQCLLIVLFLSFVYSDLTVKWYINYFNGIDYIKKGEYQKAKECLEDALAQKGKPKKSTTFYSKVRGPYTPYYYLAKVYYHLGEYEVAKSKLEMSEKFKIATKIQPDFYDLKEKIFKKLKEAKKKSIDKSIIFYQKGLEAYTSGKFQEAIKFLDEAIKINGKNSKRAQELKDQILKQIEFNRKLESDYKRGKGLFDLKKYEDALKIFKDIDRRKGFYRDVPAYIDRCKRALAIRKELEGIKSEINSGKNLMMNKEKLLSLKREGYFQSEIDGLIKILNRKLEEKSLEEKKREILKLYDEGENFYKSGNLNKAKEIFKKVSNSQYATDKLKSKCENKMEEINKKLAELSKLYNIIAEGKKLMKEGKYDESEKVLKEGLKISPSNKTILDLLTLISRFRKTGGTNEEKVKGILKNGILQYFKGNYRDSISSLSNYLNLSEKNRDIAEFFIGASYISMGLSIYGKSKMDYIKKGKEIFKKLKKKGFVLDNRLITYISPEVLNYFK